MVYKFFDRKSSCSGIKNENLSRKKSANKLHKPSTKKSIKRKVYSSFIDNIWGADFADMQSMIKFNKRIGFLLCVIDTFSKHAWIIPLKNKNVLLIT